MEALKLSLPEGQSLFQRVRELRVAGFTRQGICRALQLPEWRIEQLLADPRS